VSKISGQDPVDSSIFIKLKREQPEDIYPTLWKRMADLLSSGTAVVHKEALDELDRKADGLGSWVKQQDCIVDANDTQFNRVIDITNAHPGWVNEQRNAADPWIIALAADTEAVIVTDEKPNKATSDSNLKLPTVAAEHNVNCIDIPTWLRELKWQF